MQTDDLVLHFRRQPYYTQAEAYQVEVHRSTASYLGGAWLRRQAGHSPEGSRLTLAWCQAMRDRYRRHIERYWQATTTDDASSMASSARVSQAEVRALGQEMFEALPWSIQELLRAALRRARQRGRSLRIIFDFQQDPSTVEIARLPWELLYDPVAGSFLTLCGACSLVRSTPQAMPPLAAPTGHRRRILAIVANPRGLPAALDREEEALRQYAGASDPAESQCDLEIITGSDTLGQASRRLARGDLDGAILIAHGEIGSGLGQGFLLLADEQGNTQRVDERFLRPLFADVPGLQFVVLSVCHSGNAPQEAADGSNQELTLGERLVRDGLPLVVAMQDRISVRANRHLMRAMIDGLSQGCSVEEALRRGRKAIYQALFDPIHWSVPVLYIPTEPPHEFPWYARIADAVAEWFWRPEATRVLSGTLAVALLWTLINLAMGIETTRPWPPAALTPVQGAALFGLLFLLPAIVAALHHPQHPRVLELSRMARFVYKLQGANVGMLVGMFSALLAISLVYYSPLWPLLPEPVMQSLIALALGWAAVMSYSQARAIPRVMTVNAHVQLPRLSGNDLPVALLWPMVLLMLWLGCHLLGALWARPAVGSAIMACIFLAMVVALRRDESR